MEEIYRRDKETGILISNYGNIIGKKNKQRKFKLDRYGYLVCGCYIQSEGRMKWIPVHRLVARNFVPNPDSKPCINHLDEDKRNNNAVNLEWCTVRENNTYGRRMEAVKTSLKNGGVRKMLDTNKANGSSKAEREIKLQYKDTDDIRTFISISEASRQLGVIRSSINNVVNGKGYQAKGWHLIGDYKPITKRKEIELEKDGVRRKFESIMMAAKALGVSASLVGKVINGKNKTCAGWRLAQ